MRQWMTSGVALCGLALATGAAAQGGTARRTTERVWIDVNAGVAIAAEDTFEIRVALERFAEPAELVARYTLPRAASFDAGAGVMVTPVLGIGLSFERTSDQHSAELRAHIPHPLFANAYADDNAETGDVMRRSEGSVSVQGMVVAARTHRLRLRVFGGPTWFRIEQDAVRDITYNQFYFVRSPTNIVELTGFQFDPVDGSGWGFHAGADASLFFTRILGVGGFAKFSRGHVDLENTLATGFGGQETASVPAGGFRVGGGVRVKF